MKIDQTSWACCTKKVAIPDCEGWQRPVHSQSAEAYLSGLPSLINQGHRKIICIYTTMMKIWWFTFVCIKMNIWPIQFSISIYSRTFRVSMVLLMVKLIIFHLEIEHNWIFLCLNLEIEHSWIFLCLGNRFWSQVFKSMDSHTILILFE